MNNIQVISYEIRDGVFDNYCEEFCVTQRTLGAREIDCIAFVLISWLGF